VGQLMNEITPSTIDPVARPPHMPGVPVPVSPKKI